MAIELSKPEKALLTTILEKELEEVRSELHHTQDHDYRDNVKEREKLVRDLLAKLKA
jgi:hypothetical protein